MMPASGLPPVHSLRNRLWLGLWLLLLSLSAAFCGRQLLAGNPFHSNLLELLPRDERNPIVHDLSMLLANRFQDRLLLLVQTPSAQPEQSYSQALQLQQQLLASQRLSADNPSLNLQQQLLDLYRPYSQQLLSADTRAWLSDNSPQTLADQALVQLLSPVASPRPYPFAEDPFNLGGRWLLQLAPGLKLRQFQDLPLVDDAQNPDSSWFMISAKLNANPFDIGVQGDVIKVVDDFRQAHPQLQLLTSGMVFHAAAGTAQARAEISSVGLGSLLGIVLLVLLVFRSSVPLLAVLLVLASGCLLALTVSLLVFGRIHILTLAFGSTLLGVAVDYVLHLLVAAQRLGSGEVARQQLRYAMAIGALTSIAAYLLQLTTPFPGLQQMAVFSAAGLLGSWLSVLALAPYYRPALRGNSQPAAAQRAGEIFFPLGLALYRPLWRWPKATYAGLALAGLAALMSLLHAGANDSVINLNTSPKALLNAERQVQQIMQTPSSSRFFYLEASNREQLLKLSQQLMQRLADEHKPDLHWQGLAQYLPSAAQQQADRQLVANKLYGAEGALALLCAKLGNSCQAPALRRDLLEPDAIYTSALGELLPPLNRTDKGWQALITLSGSEQDVDMQALAAQLPGVSFVDQTRELSRLLGRYRLSVTEVLGLTLGLLGLVLGIYYRRRSWRMLLPLTLALLLALGMAASGGLTLFHLMALLLVLGIGIDTSVFYLEVGFNADSWLASSLASGTSILAFGLLSLSGVPVLHQFGAIVLGGILCCWLLNPLFHPLQSSARRATTPDINNHFGNPS